MNATPLTCSDNDAASGASNEVARTIVVTPVSLTQATIPGPGAAPPHLLWETLESAFPGPQIDPPTQSAAPASADQRLAGYVALPLALGSSAVLWVAILELMLTR